MTSCYVVNHLLIIFCPAHQFAPFPLLPGATICFFPCFLPCAAIHHFVSSSPYNNLFLSLLAFYPAQQFVFILFLPRTTICFFPRFLPRTTIYFYFFISVQLNNLFLFTSAPAQQFRYWSPVTTISILPPHINFYFISALLL